MFICLCVYERVYVSMYVCVCVFMYELGLKNKSNLFTLTYIHM